MRSRAGGSRETLNLDFILSESLTTMGDMHHPWRRLRDRLPDWQVISRPLPAGVIGATDVPRRVIFLDSTQLQAQRRCTLDHELHHAEAGDIGCQHPKREAAIDQSSARRLIPIGQLVDAVKWAYSIEELAEDCWVDVTTMRCRLNHLHPSERAAVRRALAIRDYHEEGLDDGVPQE